MCIRSIFHLNISDMVYKFITVFKLKVWKYLSTQLYY